jgi:hypothetical protein
MNKTQQEPHPYQKDIDAVVREVQSGEITISTVKWRLEQALIWAEIEMRALEILEQRQAQQSHEVIRMLPVVSNPRVTQPLEEQS